MLPAVRRCPSAAANTKTSRRQQLAFTSGARCFSASTREEKLEDAVAIFAVMDADGDGSIGFDELTKEDTQNSVTLPAAGQERVHACAARTQSMHSAAAANIA